MKKISSLYFGGFILFLIEGCGYSKLNNQPFNYFGNYYRDGHSNLILNFNKNNFVYFEQNAQPVYRCCDTIAVGNWKLDRERQLLFLTSDSSLTTYEIEGDLKEDPGDFKSDSIIVKITNPIETNWEYEESPINYKLVLQDTNFGFKIIYSDQGDQRNLLKFSWPNIGVKNIYLVIMPNYGALRLRSIPFYSIMTPTLEVKNPRSRNFEIALPQLTESFLSYKRLESDIIKIVDNTTLEWDGHLFKKR